MENNGSDKTNTEREATDCSGRLELMRVPLDNVALERFDRALLRLLDSGKAENIVLLSMMDALRARGTNEIAAYIRSASLVIPISKTVTRGAMFLYGKTVTRYMPFEFVVRLLDVIEKREGTIYLLGGRPPVLRVIEKRIRQTFPLLSVVGRFPGHFKARDEAQIIEAIRKSKASLLLVGAGVRGGEKWLAKNESKLNTGLRLWCSDIYDIFAGKKKRPSNFFFDRGLEWLGFLLRNPLRFFRIFPYIYYNCLLLAEKINLGKRQKIKNTDGDTNE